MKKSKKEGERLKRKTPKAFKDQLELIKKFQPKKTIFEDEQKHVWTVAQ